MRILPADKPVLLQQKLMFGQTLSKNSRQRKKMMRESEVNSDKYCSSRSAYNLSPSKQSIHQSLSFHTKPKNSQFVQLPGQLIRQVEYPEQFVNCNPFCPLCVKLVEKHHEFFKYSSATRRKSYLYHEDCVLKKGKYKMVLSDAAQAKLQSIQLFCQMKNIPLGSKEYYVQLQVNHPMGGKLFTKIWSKIKSNDKNLAWDFQGIPDAEIYTPNIFAIPFPDFQITTKVILLSGTGQTTNKMIVSVGRLGDDGQVVKASNGNIDLTLRIIASLEEKQKLINEMSYKYKYPLETGTAIVQFLKLQVSLSQDDQDDQLNESIGSEKSIIAGEKNKQKDDYFTNIGQALRQRSFDRQKIDLDHLIQSQYLVEFVKQSTQSRVFQVFLQTATPREIDMIISSLWDHLPELITHEYANYMVQKLISVSTLPQRLKIVQRLSNDMPSIAKNKQGTHSLQHLISLCVSPPQYNFVFDSVTGPFLNLAQHPNSTHFLQKIISVFPFNYVYSILTLVIEQFLQYACDKNGMCIIKQLIFRIGIEDKKASTQLIVEARKRLIAEIQFKLEILMMDPYGNYLIQYCFQHFSQEKVTSISDSIISKIAQFSLQKFAAPVVLKCVTQYWNFSQSLERLKDSLHPQMVIQMFKNRQGNTILLQLVEKCVDLQLKNKVIKILSSYGGMTNYSKDRWSFVMGTRSVTVGGPTYSSFTHAMQSHQSHQKSKKKKYQNKN